MRKSTFGSIDELKDDNLIYAEINNQEGQRLSKSSPLNLQRKLSKVQEERCPFDFVEENHTPPNKVEEESKDEPDRNKEPLFDENVSVRSRQDDFSDSDLDDAGLSPLPLPQLTNSRQAGPGLN